MHLSGSGWLLTVGANLDAFPGARRSRHFIVLQANSRRSGLKPALLCRPRFWLNRCKDATILFAEGNQEKKRDFLKKIGSNFQVADKSLAVEFKNPWNLLADFNSDLSNTHARQRVKSEKSNWRREGDSNPRYGLTRITV